MSVSLTDLKTKRSAMTQGEWSADGKYGSIHVNGEAAGISSMGNRPDAIGIVATHAAADVLIEIAEAALALRSELAYLQGPLSDALRAALAKITT